MTVNELCIAMLATAATRLECEGKEYDDLFEFNNDHRDRVIQSVQRVATNNHDVLIKVNLAKDYDSLMDALMDKMKPKEETP